MQNAHDFDAIVDTTVEDEMRSNSVAVETGPNAIHPQAELGRSSYKLHGAVDIEEVAVGLLR